MYGLFYTTIVITSQSKPVDLEFWNIHLVYFRNKDDYLEFPSKAGAGLDL